MEKSQLVASIVDAVRDVFATMLDMHVEHGEDYMMTGAADAQGGVVSLIGFAGSWSGAGCVSSSAEFACRISSHMFMVEYDAVTDEVLDAIAEVTNMVMGSVKTRLEESLGPMGLSIPTVIYGRNFTTRAGCTDDWIVVPFRWRHFRLEVKICLTPASDTGARRHVLTSSLANRC
jgi:chemotaxis protein CheX